MEVVIELQRLEKKNEKNELVQGGSGQVFIEPLGESRRGLWRKSDMRNLEWSRDNPLAAALPEQLPGYRISVDVRAKKVTLFDPLYDSEEGRRYSKNAKESRARKNLEFEAPIVYKGLADAQLWVWLKWCYRAVNGDNARIYSGEFPKGVAERCEQERNWDLEYAQKSSDVQRTWEPDGAIGSLSVTAGK